MKRLPDAIALVGPTACGKSSAALALAQQLAGSGGAEVISMDSALVYRGMDIGTAKPSLAEQGQVPHHLIDILDPLHHYSAAEFARDARQLIGDIRSRGKMPLLVGGTMLYFKALHEGLNDMPGTDPQVRAGIQQRARQLGWAALHAQLQTIDPVTAQRLAPNDGQRIGRALEIWTMTGRPLSEFHRASAPSADLLHIPVISLEPVERGWLHARIAQRFDAMLAAGFMEEVRRLQQRADLHADLPSIRCVGYRQAWQGLEQGWSPAEIRDRGIFASRQLAKRQLTWLRQMPQRTVVPADAPDAPGQLWAALQQQLA